MKCMFFLMFCFMVQAYANVNAQSVTIKKQNATLEEVIWELKKNTKMVFMYRDADIAGISGINLNEKGIELQDLLRKCLKGTGLDFTEINNTIIIRRTNEMAAAPQEKSVTVTGKVTDARKQLMPGVTVILQGTTLGTATDVNGEFKLTLPEKEGVLVFSFIGMKTQNVNFNGQEVINVVMEEDVEMVEEVVVTGIFTRKKEGFTGSITKVSSEEIKQLSSGNVLKALQMIDPSFSMTSSNISGSNPNAVPEFQMRGQANLGDYQSDDVVMMRGDYNSRPNQPLFVLDGVIGVTATTIMDLDPEQVESITMLKDASATAIYGSEAANGVVVVETKKPQPGKLRVTYNGNYGISTPDLRDYNLTNAREKLEVEERAGYFNTAEIGKLQYYTALKQDIERGVDTDWLAKPLQDAFTHRHGINFEGGDISLRYKVYLGASFSPGVMKNTDLDTKSGRIDIQYRFGKFMILNQTYLDYSKGRRESNYGHFSLYAQLNPYYTPYDEEGNIKQILDPQTYYFGFYGATTYNPLYNTLYESRNENRSFDVKEAIKIEYLPIDNLRLSLDFAISRSDETVETFKSSKHTESVYYTDPTLKGSYLYSKREGYDYRLSLTGSYNKTFKLNHMLAVYAQYMINESVTNQMSLNMSGFPSDRLSEVFMGTTFKNISGNEAKTRKLGFAFTANYIYKQRYAVDFNLRIDASSQFGKNNRFAPFWSAGFRWSAHKENFIANLNVFDELTLNGSYGVTGSQGFDSYQALQMYTYADLMSNYKGSDESGVELYGLGNPDLKWQQTRNYNVALNLGVLDSRISARVEYYYKMTKNTVLDFTLAPSLGFSVMKDNLGRISNQGLEASLRFTPYKNASKQAYWNILVNGVHNRTKIEEISNALKYKNEQQMENTKNKPLPRYESGYSMSAIWAVPSMGIDPATGNEVFMKRNGTLTSVWDAADQIKVGDTEPDLKGTVSTTFGYRGLSLTVAGQYTFGGQMYNKTLIDKVENANLRMNVDKRVLYDRWSKPGDVAMFKRLDGDYERTKTKASSRFVMDNNEFKISTINLSYRMDNTEYDFLKNVGISSATVGLYFEDILRVSTIKMERGIDYPFARNFSMSLNVVF